MLRPDEVDDREFGFFVQLAAGERQTNAQIVKIFWAGANFRNKTLISGVLFYFNVFFG